MKKLLIVTRWYLPATKSGGTVRSVSALVNGLKEDFEVSIVTSDRDLGADEPYSGVEFDKWTLHRGIPIVYLSRLDLKSMSRCIATKRPDIIYLNSFFDITTQLVMFLKFIGKIEATIVLAPRGELAKGALSIKSTKKRLYLLFYKLLNLSKNIIFHATSKEDMLDIKKIFPSNRVVVIQNPKEESSQSYRLPLKEKNRLKMVFISRIAPVKNLLYALEILAQSKFTGSILFDIYGPDEDKEYWRACKEMIKKLPPNIQVDYRGFVEPSQIGDRLSNYHLFFLPTKGENFGHAIVEAMRVGLIPIISDKTPWQNLEDFNAGFSLSLEDSKAFFEAIEKVLEMDDEQFRRSSNGVKKYISNRVNSKKNLKEYKDFFKSLS